MKVLTKVVKEGLKVKLLVRRLSVKTEKCENSPIIIFVRLCVYLVILCGSFIYVLPQSYTKDFTKYHQGFTGSLLTIGPISSSSFFSFYNFYPFF